MGLADSALCQTLRGPVLSLQLATGATSNLPLPQPPQTTSRTPTTQPRSVSMNRLTAASGELFPAGGGLVLCVCVCVFFVGVSSPVLLSDGSWLCLVSSSVCL